jgi:hypothetical protein
MSTSDLLDAQSYSPLLLRQSTLVLISPSPRPSWVRRPPRLLVSTHACASRPTSSTSPVTLVVSAERSAVHALRMRINKTNCTCQHRDRDRLYLFWDASLTVSNTMTSYLLLSPSVYANVRQPSLLTLPSFSCTPVVTSLIEFSVYFSFSLYTCMHNRRLLLFAISSTPPPLNSYHHHQQYVQPSFHSFTSFSEFL